MLSRRVHLEGMFHDLQDRYGNDDPIVLQFKQALEARQAYEPRYPRRVATYPERRWRIASGRRLDGMPGSAI